MLQSTDPEILGSKEGSWGHTQISLGRGNRRDSVSGLMVGGDGNMKGCVFYLLYLLISWSPTPSGPVTEELLYSPSHTIAVEK